MIGFRDQIQLVAEVAGGVVHEVAPTSYNVVLPPGFGEDTLAEEIAKELRTRDSRALVAILSSDNIRNVEDYIDRLHQQWSETVKLPEVRADLQIDAALKQLLHALPAGRRAVQIVKRFDKILDVLDRFVLGALRDAENLARLRSVILAPYGYDELKKRWEHAGRVLTASDYGDSHAVRAVEPATATAILEAVSAAGWAPRHVTELVLELTGGHPEPFRAVVEEWIRKGKPDLRPDVKRLLRTEAERRMGRFVRKLDLPDESRYRDLLIDLHQGVDVDDALLGLSHHPWASILLKDEGLRAEAVGSAAVAAAIDEAVKEQRLQDVPHGVLEKGRILYERKQYAAAVRLLDAVERPTNPLEIKVLRAHAGVMSHLYAEDSGEAGVDTDWHAVTRSIEKARQTIKGAALQPPDLLGDIERRYSELESLSRRIEGAMRGGAPRIVDALAGFGPAPADPPTALVLVALKILAGRALAGHASACHCVLALPEQIFRIWALWALGLDYYHAPAGAEAVWQRVQNVWPHGALTRAAPGGQFPSFESFAYFAVELLRDRQADDLAAPERDHRSLARAISALSVRRDSAHAVVLTTARVRTQLFEVIGRWFDALLAPCKAHTGYTNEQIAAQIAPLPILDQDGSILWLE